MRLLILASLFAATAAMADAPLPKPATAPQKPAAPSVSQSVWRLGADGSAEHLQSGLQCPRHLLGYDLNTLITYDRFGLDVSCGYNEGGDKALTIYVTRLPEAKVEAAYTDSKAQILKRGAAAHPTLVSERRFSQGRLTWSRAVFAEDGGVHTALWMATLPGSFLEYRATYPASAETSVVAALTRMGDIVQASAEPRLSLCAMSPAPVRQGAVVSDAKRLKTMTTMASVLDAADMAAAQGRKGEENPPIWCVEEGSTRDGIPLLFWRGVTKDGQDAHADRVTAVTTGPPPTLDIVLDPLLNLALAKAAKGETHGEQWTATVRRGVKTWIYGFFDGRPSTDLTASLLVGALQGQAKALGAFSVDGKQITINLPPTSGTAAGGP